MESREALKAALKDAALELARKVYADIDPFTLDVIVKGVLRETAADIEKSLSEEKRNWSSDTEILQTGEVATSSPELNIPPYHEIWASQMRSHLLAQRESLTEAEFNAALLNQVDELCASLADVSKIASVKELVTELISDDELRRQAVHACDNYVARSETIW